MRKSYALSDILPNPFRRMESYPIRRDKVEALKESIESTGFWTNLVAREINGRAEIAYGHHRWVALRELYDQGHEIALEIRDLDDARMIQIMARENMEEWGSSAAVEHETVRAVVKAYADGRIELEQPAKDVRQEAIRYVAGARTRRPYTAHTIAAFVGWANVQKVQYAMGALEFIDEGILDESDFAELGTKAAQAVIVEARRARDHRERVADQHRKQAEEAAARAKAEGDAVERRRLQRASAAALKNAEKVRELGTRQARHVGRELANEIRTGETTARQARDRARQLDEIPKVERPVWADDAVGKLASTINRILDPDGDLAMKIESAIAIANDCTPSVKDDLAKTLDQLATRASGYAEQLRGTPATNNRRLKLIGA